MRPKLKKIIAKVEVRRESGGFQTKMKDYAWFVMLARNGQVVATSEVYDNHSNAKRAAKRMAAQLEVPLTEEKL